MSHDERKRQRRHSRERSPDYSEKRRRRSEDREHRRERDHSRERIRVRVKEEPRDDDSRSWRSRDDRPSHRRDDRKRRLSGDEGQKEKERKFAWGKSSDDKVKTEEEDVKPKEKPNFGLSGNLAKDTNVFNGVVVKYNEPPEARKPKLRWRLYPFKGDEALEFIPVHRQSAYLFGRDRRVADVPVDHPSCSKQHAVLQYRFIKRTLDDGTVSRRVRPYVIDLGSANGTYVNNERIDPERYYELFEKDIVKFGFSSRDYVLLHENSQAEVEAEEVNDETEAGAEKQDT